MAFAGWRFFVLSPAFAIHRGLHNPGNKTHDQQLEIANNRFRVKSFLKEKVSQYKDEHRNFRLMYMSKEIKKIYKTVSENTWHQCMVERHGGHNH